MNFALARIEDRLDDPIVALTAERAAHPHQHAVVERTGLQRKHLSVGQRLGACMPAVTRSYARSYRSYGLARVMRCQARITAGQEK